VKNYATGVVMEGRRILSHAPGPFESHAGVFESYAQASYITGPSAEHSDNCSDSASDSSGSASDSGSGSSSASVSVSVSVSALGVRC
jgi:hypothetical protein